MRKHLKSVVLICLLAVWVIALTSCGIKSVVLASPELPFNGSILFDSETENSEIAREAALEFKDMLAEHSLGNIRTVMSSSLINELEGEILFGSSNREASIKAEELLLSKNAYETADFYWCYCYLDGKLAIVANHEIAYTLAVRGFFESYLVDGSIVIPDDLLVCDTLPYSEYEAMFDLPKGESVPETEAVEIDLTLGEGYDMGQGSKLYIQNDSDIFAYIELRQSLEAAGFKYYTGNRIGNNVFATYLSENQIVHTMFFYNKNEIRIAVDKRGEDGFSVAGLESENIYTSTGESVMTLVDIEPADYDGGLCMIFKLSDGRFFIVDSGVSGRNSASGTSAGWVYATLAKHADDPGNIEVAAWLLTHSHSDHIGGLYDLAKGSYNADGKTHPLAPEKITEKIKIERIIYNEHSMEGGEYTCVGWVDTIIDAFDVKNVVKAHPGQEFFIADLKLTIFGSQDLVIGQNKIDNINEFSIVSMIEFNGKSLLSLADAFPKQNAQIAKIYKTALKADVIQVAHHGYADTGAKSVNNYCDPDIVLWPNSEEGMAKYTVIIREQNAIFLTKKNYAPHGGNIDFDSKWNASEHYSVLDLIPVCSCGCEKKSAMDTAERGVAAE